MMIRSGFCLMRRIHTIAPIHRQKSFKPILFKDEMHKFVCIHVVFNDEYASFAHVVNILRLTFTGNEYNHEIL